jgi:hypothetical protein
VRGEPRRSDFRNTPSGRSSQGGLVSVENLPESDRQTRDLQIETVVQFVCEDMQDHINSMHVIFNDNESCLPKPTAVSVRGSTQFFPPPKCDPQLKCDPQPAGFTRTPNYQSSKRISSTKNTCIDEKVNLDAQYYNCHRTTWDGKHQSGLFHQCLTVRMQLPCLFQGQSVEGIAVPEPVRLRSFSFVFSLYYLPLSCNLWYAFLWTHGALAHPCAAFTLLPLHVSVT